MLFAWKQHWGCVKVHRSWNSHCQPSDFMSNFNSYTQWLSYSATCPSAENLLRSFANHLFCEYWERTTPSRIFVPCNLSSWWVCEKFSLPKIQNIQTNHQPHFKKPFMKASQLQGTQPSHQNIQNQQPAMIILWFQLLWRMIYLVASNR